MKKGWSRNRTFGLIGTIWGGSVVMRSVLSGPAASSNGAYAAGQNGASIFGALMLIVGLYYLIKG